MAIGAYSVYGDHVLPNVALVMETTPLSLAANVLMAIHLLSAFIIIINPVFQEMEELYNVPRGEFECDKYIRAPLRAFKLNMIN